MDRARLNRHVAAIYNAAWFVRHYRRPASRNTDAHARAIRAMGLAVREAFNSTEDFYPLLVAVYRGLHTNDEEAPF